MEFIKSSEIRILANPGVESYQLVSPHNSNSKRLTITKVLVQPGIEQRRHAHESSEQVWIAIRGRGELLLGDDKTASFGQGDVARFEDGEVHGLQNNSIEPFEYFAVTSPPIDFSTVYGERKNA